MNNNVIKCPTCGGEKWQELENGKYKCMYCGSIINCPQEKESNNSPTTTQTPQPQQPVIVKVVNSNTQRAVVKKDKDGCWSTLEAIAGFIAIIIFLVRACS